MPRCSNASMPCIERTVECTDRHGSIERYVPQGTALGGTAWRG
jgi:hypothetical protein